MKLTEKFYDLALDEEVISAMFLDRDIVEFTYKDGSSNVIMFNSYLDDWYICGNSDLCVNSGSVLTGRDLF